jgi:hypothetical protein
VPRLAKMPLGMTRLDCERQCEGILERDGFVRVSGG